MEVIGTKQYAVTLEDNVIEQVVIEKLKKDYQLAKDFNDPESLKDTEAIKQVLDMYGEKV